MNMNRLSAIAASQMFDVYHHFSKQTLANEITYLVVDLPYLLIALPVDNFSCHI